LIDERIGTIAPKLLFPSFEIQCAGVALNSDRLPDHVYKGVYKDDPGYFFSLVGQREVSANTGAFLLVKRNRFKQVNGFNEELAINYNDIDFCLRLNSLGLTNVIVNYLVSFHLESASRAPVVHSKEEVLFLANLQNYQEIYYPMHLQSQPLNYNLQGFNSIRIDSIMGY
jgi:GT2 family glycosyltransferase